MIGPAVALVLVAMGADDPYVRSRTSGEGEQACLHWSAGGLEVRQSTTGVASVPEDGAFDAVGRALSHWQDELRLCGNLTLVEGSRTATRKVGYRAGATNNENVLLFREHACSEVVADPSDPCWANGTCGNAYDCWEHSPGTIALTTTSFDPKTGKLFDADVEANAVNFFFTVVDSPPCEPGQVRSTCVGFDVENTFTHELGHVLGLAHTTNPNSTMNPSAPLGETSKRTLDPGTQSFVCVAYPRGLPSTDCLPVPDHITGTSFSCTQAPGGVEAALLVWGARLALAQLRRARRRKRP